MEVCLRLIIDLKAKTRARAEVGCLPLPPDSVLLLLPVSETEPEVGADVIGHQGAPLSGCHIGCRLRHCWPRSVSRCVDH